ncbi:MAG: DNA replication and repair protein RecF [Chlamydiota bacterium]|nr:DNA replication and repair protein RecF [Chlamydiota bacterium]
MTLRKITLRNFRNSTHATFSFQQGVNWIEGPNGTGKTSILEALHLLSTGQSFRTHRLKECIQTTHNAFMVEAEYEKEGVQQTLSISFTDQGRRYYDNGTALPSAISLLGLLPSTLLDSKQTSLIMGTPSQRRKFLNIQIAQQYPHYAQELVRYQQGLRQRNHLLKEEIRRSLDSWESALAKAALPIMRKRKELITFFNLHLKDPHRLAYLPSISENRWDDLKAFYEEQRERDLRTGTTLQGPHRDDVCLLFEGHPADQYASEGQKRLFIAALKSIEWEGLASNTPTSPLFLVDDFGVHLDSSNQNLLFEGFFLFPQVIITAPQTLPFPGHRIPLSPP